MESKSLGRIYNAKADINETDTKEFWNKRAGKYTDENPYVSVKLGDKNPERAQQWDVYEKSNILQLLNITHNDNVIDIGCGIGRLAEAIIPCCSYYLGVDYAENLIEIAKERISFPGKSYDFATLAMQDIYKGNSVLPHSTTKRYTVAVIAGVLVFMNDNTVKQALNNLLSVMADSCRIYIAGTAGVSQRLTLDNFYSDDLNAKYSIIHRTENEMMELCSVLYENGFQLSKRGDMAIDTANNAETKRVFYIFKR